LVGMPKGKMPLRTPRQRWENGIKNDLRETGWKGEEWTHLAQNREQCQALVNTVMNLLVLTARS
jgi:hypothetical protein